MYTFVFMVALGIDYNIMLVSRIKEFALKHPWKEAVRLGIAWTGGVVSSSGIYSCSYLLCFDDTTNSGAVLFGFVMAVGILLDTFLIRGFSLPAILVLIKR